MRKAVIGIGSNSIRLLVADVTDGRIACVHRGRADARPFEGLVNGRFTPESIQNIVQTVSDFRQDAMNLGAAALFLSATSATRDAKNQGELAARLLERTGLAVRILSGEEEAAASFAGGALPGECGLLDIGGGSTEIVVGKDGIPSQRVSLQLGAVRLYRSNPLTSTEEIAPLLERTVAWIRETWNQNPNPDQWVGVGGTCTTLAAMDSGAPESAQGHELTRDAVRDLLFTLTPLSLEERKKRPGLPARRADVI
nr:hypothetical protein [Clostridia bacterium]